MLIPFPIAFFIGAFVFDVLGLLLDDSNLNRTSFYLAVSGIITGVAAAVPGFIDYLFSVPPQSTGKQRATKHMIVNLAAVALFVAVVIIKDKIYWIPSASLIIMETAGAVLLFFGGWMGGTLVNRNFIGPDHRYANAGKWKEISFRSRRKEYVVAREDELKTDHMKLVRVMGKRIVICRTEEGYTAFDDRCTHRGGSLAGGVTLCGSVFCLWHGSRFDVKNGQVINGPAKLPVKTYTTTVRDGKVFLIFT